MLKFLGLKTSCVSHLGLSVFRLTPLTPGQIGPNLVMMAICLLRLMKEGLIEEPLVRKHFVAAFGRYAASWEVDVHPVEVQMSLLDYHPEQVSFGIDVNIRVRTSFVSIVDWQVKQELNKKIAQSANGETLRDLFFFMMVVCGTKSSLAKAFIKTKVSLPQATSALIFTPIIVQNVTGPAAHRCSTSEETKNLSHLLTTVVYTYNTVLDNKYPTSNPPPPLCWTLDTAS